MTEPTPVEEVSDADLEALRERIEAVIEAQARQRQEIIQHVAAAVAPLVHQLQVQNAQAERQSAVIH